MQTPKFNVEFLEEAELFLETLDEKARYRTICNITKARFSKDKELFKKLNDEIWEFRTLYQKTQYRLLAFWDNSDKTNNLVIGTHGLIRKTGRVPQRDLDKAESVRKTYFKQKKYKK